MYGNQSGEFYMDKNTYQYCWYMLSLAAKKSVISNNSFKELKKKTVINNTKLVVWSEHATEREITK